MGGVGKMLRNAFLTEFSGNGVDEEKFTDKVEEFAAREGRDVRVSPLTV